MEMPEGWKALMENNLKLGRHDSCYSLNLMKEMAEALEGYSDNDSNDKAEVLKKFKEWK
jgi:hypothetical protein